MIHVWEWLSDNPQAEIERLRQRNDVLETAHQQTRKTLDHAYAEIERLRAELELAEAEIEYRDRTEIFPADAKEAEIKRLRVENERLVGERAAQLALQRR